MNKMGIFLVAAAIFLIVSNADGKQLIRLKNGKECLLPGYYRDAVNCQKFYYCPTPRSSTKPLSIQEQEELNKFIDLGVFCPEGSIFDETIGSCNALTAVKAIPPECLDLSKQEIYSTSTDTKFGNKIKNYYSLEDFNQL